MLNGISQFFKLIIIWKIKSISILSILRIIYVKNNSQIFDDFKSLGDLNSWMNHRSHIHIVYVVFIKFKYQSAKNNLHLQKKTRTYLKFIVYFCSLDKHSTNDKDD